MPAYYNWWQFQLFYNLSAEKLAALARILQLFLHITILPTRSNPFKNPTQTTENVIKPPIVANKSQSNPPIYSTRSNQVHRNAFDWETHKAATSSPLAPAPPHFDPRRKSIESRTHSARRFHCYRRRLLCPLVVCFISHSRWKKNTFHLSFGCQTWSSPWKWEIFLNKSIPDPIPMYQYQLVCRPWT